MEIKLFYFILYYIYIYIYVYLATQKRVQISWSYFFFLFWLVKLTLTNLAEHMQKEGTRCLSLPSTEEMHMKIS